MLVMHMAGNYNVQKCRALLVAMMSYLKQSSNEIQQLVEKLLGKQTK